MFAFIEEVPRVCAMVAGVCSVGIIVGYPAAHWIGRKVAEILACMPTEKFLRPQPALGIPRTKAMRGDFQGAAAGYEELLHEHPHEKEIYFRLLEIALGPMRDLEYGRDVLERGLVALTNERERAALVQMGEEIVRGDYTPFRHSQGYQEPAITHAPNLHGRVSS